MVKKRAHLFNQSTPGGHEQSPLTPVKKGIAARMVSVEALTALNLGDVITPAFLVDLDVCARNAENMREKCKKLKVNLRPHMKTHKTLELAELMTAGTKRCIVVSTLSEAEFFADGGYDDILLAIPFAKDKIPRMRSLAERLTLFHVLLDSNPILDNLLASPLSGDRKWSVYLKVDCGYHRAGVPWDGEDGLALASRLHSEERVAFQGLYTHEGDSYDTHGEDELKQAGSSAARKLLTLSQRLVAEGIPCHVIAMGSTPSCSRPGPGMEKLTEFHPGNYIFYDSEHVALSACAMQDVACVVVTRVIGAYPWRNQLLVDCGWTALSLDGQGALPGNSFCLIAGEPNLRLKKMSQETGTLEPIEGRIDFDKFPVGRLLYFLPYHSCATAAMHPTYHVHSGGKMVAQYHPCRGW